MWSDIVERAPHALLYLVLPSAAASAGVLAIVFLLLKRRLPGVAVALAVVAGLAAGNAVSQTLAWKPTTTGYEALLIAAFVAVALAAVGSLVDSSRLASFGLPVLGAIVASVLLVPEYIRGPAWLGAFGLLVLANWLVLDGVRIGRERADSPGSRVGLLAGLAIVLLGGCTLLMVFAQSGRMADLATLLLASLVGVAVVAWVGGIDARAGLAAVAVYVPGLMLSALHETFSDVPTVSFVLLAATPLTLSATLLPPIRRLGANQRLLVEFLLLALPVIVALGMAVWQSPAMPAEILGVSPVRA